ncbi:MAG TPA: hypothetical protein VFQ61_14270 [Polyangiaceae bacterium]|nr:hypothetical protein [Polyangiaceae bacterium]
MRTTSAKKLRASVIVPAAWAAICLLPASASGANAKSPKPGATSALAEARAASPNGATPARNSNFETRKLPNGATLRVSAGTQLTLGRPIKVQTGPGRWNQAQSVQLLEGRVEVDVPSQCQPSCPVYVQAPRRVGAVAKAGRSVVIASAERVTLVALEGEMLAASGNDWRHLSEGTVREFAPGAGPVDHAVMKAPETTLSAPIALSLSGGKAGLTAKLSAVPGAARYELDLYQLDGSKRTFLERRESDTPTTSFENLAPGSYGVVARAVERTGVEGQESAQKTFRVVGAELPVGATLVEGGILLPVRERVRLSGTEGIEVSYGRTAEFIRAPSSIGVIRNSPTLVRLRAEGSAEELAMTLSPRVMRADIELKPARARWPEDDVRVAVKLLDGMNRPLPEGSPLKPTVFVNAKRVDIGWTRANGTLVATVPKSNERGPWVVRVEVIDDSGAVVGRDFLEVAASAKRAAR